MPQILALPFAFAPGWVSGAATLGSTVTGALSSSLGTGLIGLGLTVAVSALLRPDVPEPTSGQIETTQPVPERFFVYGRMEISGPLAFKKVKAGTSVLYKIVLMHDGQLDAWETLKLDDRIGYIDPTTHYFSNIFYQDGARRVQCYLYDGSDSQTADADLIAAFPDIWTTNHRLRGIAYAIIVCHGIAEEHFAGGYPHGEPTFKAVIRGRRLWDLRDASQIAATPSTWVWSDNAGLALLDWISLHPKGYRVPLAKIDLASFITLAFRCDEPIVLKTGGCERRYRIATRVSLKESRTSVLQRLCEACDAHLYPTAEGKWAVRGGNWRAPNVTLDASLGHLVDLEMKDGADALSRYNEIALRFLSPNNNYTENECDSWLNTSDPEYIAGKRKTKDVDLLQVPSHGQARRLAKIMTAFDNPKWLGSAITNFYGLNVIGEPNCTLNWSEPGESNDGPFWLTPGVTMLDNFTGVRADLRACDPLAYVWYPMTEEGAAVKVLPPAEADYTPGTPPLVPTDFAVTGGVKSAAASWKIPSDPAYYLARLWRAEHYTNAFLQSEDVENASWAKTGGIDAFGSGSVANTTAIVDPLGTNTANFVRFTSGHAGADTIQQTLTGFAANQDATMARWFKYDPGGPEWVTMYLMNNAITADYISCFYNIRLQTVGATKNNGTASGATGDMIAFPDGWCLCILKGKPSTTSTNGVRTLERPAQSGTNDNYPGDGVHGFYLWRAQLEPGLTVHRPLIKTTTTAASHAPFDSALEVSGPRYRAKATDSSAMEPPGTVVAFTDRVTAGVYDYYVTAENPIGDRCAPVGPQHATVTSS